MDNPKRVDHSPWITRSALPTYPPPLPGVVFFFLFSFEFCCEGNEVCIQLGTRQRSKPKGPRPRRAEPEEARGVRVSGRVERGPALQRRRRPSLPAISDHPRAIPNFCPSESLSCQSCFSVQAKIGVDIVDLRRSRFGAIVHPDRLCREPLRVFRARSIQ